MWPLAVLAGDCIYGFFFIRKCTAVLLGRKKTGRNNEVTVSQWNLDLWNIHITKSSGYDAWN